MFPGLRATVLFSRSWVSPQLADLYLRQLLAGRDW